MMRCKSIICPTYSRHTGRFRMKCLKFASTIPAEIVRDRTPMTTLLDICIQYDLFSTEASMWPGSWPSASHSFRVIWYCWVTYSPKCKLANSEVEERGRFRKARLRTHAMSSPILERKNTGSGKSTLSFERHNLTYKSSILNEREKISQGATFHVTFLANKNHLAKPIQE